MTKGGGVGEVGDGKRGSGRFERNPCCSLTNLLFRTMYHLSDYYPTDIFRKTNLHTNGNIKLTIFEIRKKVPRKGYLSLRTYDITKNIYF